MLLSCAMTCIFYPNVSSVFVIEIMKQRISCFPFIVFDLNLNVYIWLFHLEHLRSVTGLFKRVCTVAKSAY